MKYMWIQLWLFPWRVGWCRDRLLFMSTPYGTLDSSAEQERPNLDIGTVQSHILLQVDSHAPLCLLVQTELIMSACGAQADLSMSP